MADNNNAMSPISAAEPPKSPLSKPTVTGAKTIKLNPVIRKPTVGGASGVRPMIRKPGGTIAAKPLPKPVAPVSTPVATPAPAPDASAAKPMEQLKSVTQKLKGITQEIPQQAILRKTGIIDDGAVSEAQKQAAKSKTARISLNDAIGAAPVKNDAAPMKTIRIKRPVDLPSSAPSAAAPSAVAPAEGESEADITQRKTLKVARPGSAVRPTGKFGIKRPAAAAAPAVPTSTAEGAVSDIADIPDVAPIAPVPAAKDIASDGPAWLGVLSTVVQVAACVAMGALAWFLFQNTQVAYF